MCRKLTSLVWVRICIYKQNSLRVRNMFHRCWPRDHSPACPLLCCWVYWISDSLHCEWTCWDRKGDGEHGHHAAGAGQDMESYSGFISADKANHGNMFFWFTTKNPCLCLWEVLCWQDCMMVTLTSSTTLWCSGHECWPVLVCSCCCDCPAGPCCCPWLCCPGWNQWWSPEMDMAQAKEKDWIIICIHYHHLLT